MDVTAPDRTPGNGGRGRYSDKIAPVSDLISIDEARRRVLDAVTRLGNEDVPLDLALGRVLAEDVTSGIDVPPFDSSGMDGYALIAGPEAELEVIGEARAGHPAAGRFGQARRSASRRERWCPRAPMPWCRSSERQR